MKCYNARCPGAYEESPGFFVHRLHASADKIPVNHLKFLSIDSRSPEVSR